MDDKPNDPAPDQPARPDPAVPSAAADNAEAPPKPVETPRISIDRFFKTELKVALVLAAERIEGTDKLMKLQIDLGTEQRQLVAGVALSYEPEALIGKRIIVVANLKPAKIRGVESQGMLLAADLDGRPIVASFDEDIPPGTRVR